VDLGGVGALVEFHGAGEAPHRLVVGGIHREEAANAMCARVCDEAAQQQRAEALVLPVIGHRNRECHTPASAPPA
jgi:hypothetical protein